jgi:MioC protein
MAKTKILVATMTGMANLAAQEVADVLSAAGEDAEILQMDDLDAGAIADGENFIVVSSTYGQGDIPDNGQNFFMALKTYTPDLSAKRYAVFGLGDRTFGDTYCAAGEAWDEVFADLGAKPLAPLFRHDASSPILPEDAAKEWAQSTILPATREAV